MKKLIKFSGVLAILAGLILVAGGVWAICFTYKNVAREKITTPTDSSIPGIAVRGPVSLHVQSDIIREHTLKITGNKTYSEMPRLIEKTDPEGNTITDKDGKPIMMENNARNIWITATTLTTALHLAIVTYVLGSFIILFGLISIWTGIILYMLSKIKITSQI